MAKKFVFEEAVIRLEEIVGLLSSGNVALDKSLELFEEGTSLIKKCGDVLDKAEQTVNMLVKTPEGPKEMPFDQEGE